MPIVGPEKLNADPEVLAQVAEWVLEFGRGQVAFQSVGSKLFVYRVPTMGQLLDLEVAEAQSPIVATDTFLKKVVLGKMPRLRPNEVGQIMEMIIKEHFPKGEEGLRNDLLRFTHSHMKTLVGALDTHLREMGADLTSRDMTYSEVLEHLSIKQIIYQKPIMKGSMPRQERRGVNVKQERTKRS